MKCFPDTSFLCTIYRAQTNSPRADQFMTSLSGPLPLSSLLLLEFRQSVRLQVWLNQNDQSKGFSRTEGDAMLRDLQTDINTGIVITRPVDWAHVFQRAETLSSIYTESKGSRLVDLLHIATALHLGAREFLTFDASQKEIAEAEGMKTPL